MAANNRIGGLIICGALFVWIGLAEHEREKASIESRISDTEYSTTELEAQVAELKQELGTDYSFGPSQSDRIDELERRVRMIEIFSR